MRFILLACALTISSSSGNAATTLEREMARVECARLADAQILGKLNVQRSNFIKNCLIDMGFK
jgi:hypothetical protein